MTGNGPRSIYSRPLVPSMGQHDPLDGFVTSVQLQTTARALAAVPEGPQRAGAVVLVGLLRDFDRA